MSGRGFDTRLKHHCVQANEVDFMLSQEHWRRIKQRRHILRKIFYGNVVFEFELHRSNASFSRRMDSTVSNATGLNHDERLKFMKRLDSNPDTVLFSWRYVDPDQRFALEKEFIARFDGEKVNVRNIAAWFARKGQKTEFTFSEAEAV